MSGLFTIVAGFLLVIGGFAQVRADYEAKKRVDRLEGALLMMTDTDNKHTSSIEHLTAAIKNISGVR